jgi:hypothetical protein
MNRPKKQMLHRRSVCMVAMVVATLWAAAMARGIQWLAAYEFEPGHQADAPARWPNESRVSPDAGKFNLLIFMHSRCPCSTATLGELVKIVAHAGDRLSVHVLFVRPPGVDDEWVRTSLFDTARAIPHVIAEMDPDGIEAHRFGAATSGQTALYDPRGTLVFSGGITSSRGHEGDNIGASAVLAAIDDAATPLIRTPVFGCSLLNSPDTSVLGKAGECRK